jgi:membrane protease YdiL (CAAX protease family)
MEDRGGGVERRPLWRRIVDYPLVAMLIAVGLYFVVMIVAGALDVMLMPRIPGFNFEMKFDIVAIPLLLILYALVIRRLGEHPHDDYRDPLWLRRLALGLGLGLAVFSAAVAIAAAFGLYRIRGQGDLSGLVPALIASAIFPAISEEMLFRGILFRWIEEFGGSWAALIVSSILFGAAHALNPGSSIVATSFIAVEAGLLLGGAYMLTRSLWLPMGIHAAWNFTQGEIYDIPVSGLDQHGLLQAKLSGPSLLTGGSFGLEASLLTLVVATAVGLWVIGLAIRKGEIVRPRWVRRRRLTAAA